MYKDPQRKGNGHISYGGPLKLMLRELWWSREAFLPLIVSNLSGALNLHDWSWKVFESSVNVMVKRFCSLLAAKDLFHAAFVWLFCGGTLPDQPVSRKIFLLPCWGSIFSVCQVVGVDDFRLGEEVCVCIKLMDGQECTEEEIKAYCKGKVRHHPPCQHSPMSSNCFTFHPPVRRSH